MRSPSSADKALGRVWDALLTDSPPPARLNPDDLIVIQALYDHDDAPVATSVEIDEIWSSIVAAAPQVQSNTEVAIAARPARRTRLSGWLRSVFVASLAGFITGFFVLGGGGRIVMRIVAMMAEPGMKGGTTENSFVVGEITLAGTWELMLQGGLAGIGLGLGYLAIRRWLPSDGWRQMLSMGVVMTLVVGATALDFGENPDYQRFGILGVNVCLFTFLPFLYGLAIGPAWTFLDRRVSRSAPSIHMGWKIALLSIGMVCVIPVALQSVVLMVFLVPPMTLVFLAPLFEIGLRRWEQHRQQTVSDRGVAIVRWAAVGLPCLVGLVMIVISVQRLMNGV